MSKNPWEVVCKREAIVKERETQSNKAATQNTISKTANICSDFSHAKYFIPSMPTNLNARLAFYVSIFLVDKIKWCYNQIRQLPTSS